MKSLLKKIYLVIILIACIPSVVFCWNSQGHRTSGAVAYYYLKANNRDVINKILQTLTFHPWYNSKWGHQLSGMTGETREIELFMLASTFPDDARGTNLEPDEQGQWHYVDYPFVPEGQKAKGLPPKVPNAQIKIQELLEVLKTEKDCEQKAIDICWLFHLIEDIHQPLHCTSMYNSTFPEGDKGGNSVFIKIRFGEEQNLHHYWDAAPVADDEKCADKAWELMIKYPRAQLDELKVNKDVTSWIKEESYPMAIKYAYLGGKVNGVQGSPTRLFDDYEKSTLNICQRRVVLGGIRLAQQLVDIYGGGEAVK